MNDKKAIKECIMRFGGIGFIIAEIDPKFDYDLSFKKWHDEFKGKKSKYVLKREKEGSWKRIRKKEITFIKILFIYFNSLGDLKKGYDGKWLKDFQEGMRNANDNLRLVKIQCQTEEIPKEFILYKIDIS